MSLECQSRTSFYVVASLRFDNDLKVGYIAVLHVRFSLCAVTLTNVTCRMGRLLLACMAGTEQFMSCVLLCSNS